ncbi:MAG: VCBS repeat-containing protein [Planctomycetota bacterium]|nr:MAG: VCBS repeat-containing protein [Planctomycetota bacterium]
MANGTAWRTHVPQRARCIMRTANVWRAWTAALSAAIAAGAAAQQRIELSDDGRETVVFEEGGFDGVVLRGGGVPYGAAPDWQNNLRRQVGALQVADMNGDGWNDVVVGCYISNSFPPYDDWHNMIYFNTGGQLETNPSWISDDQVSTGDIQVGDINGDTYPDIFAANGGSSMSPSVIYFGGPGGPSTTPGWTSAEPGLAWNNYAILYDFDHDGDLDVVTANQGNSQFDPYRPMYMFRNNNGVLPTVPSWQSAESSIQNFLAFADFDGDGFEDLAVSKWANFESGIYKNLSGNLATTPVWTTGDTDTDKGVAWADVDDNGWPDLALGHDPTRLYANTAGSLTLSWSATAPYFGHSDLRFADVNRDDLPDLVETHFSDGRVHIYLNQGGVLASSPSWTYDSSSVGTAIALGDLNGDQWLDLVVGNSGEPCVKVFYAIPPACIGDTDADGDVDLTDLAILLAHFDQTGAGIPGDVDDDGDVDLADLAQLLANFDQQCW